MPHAFMFRVLMPFSCLESDVMSMDDGLSSRMKHCVHLFHVVGEGFKVNAHCEESKIYLGNSRNFIGLGASSVMTDTSSHAPRKEVPSVEGIHEGWDSPPKPFKRRLRLRQQSSMNELTSTRTSSLNFTPVTLSYFSSKCRFTDHQLLFFYLSFPVSWHPLHPPVAAVLHHPRLLINDLPHPVVLQGQQPLDHRAVMFDLPRLARILEVSRRILRPACSHLD